MIIVSAVKKKVFFSATINHYFVINNIMFLYLFQSFTIVDYQLCTWLDAKINFDLSVKLTTSFHVTSHYIKGDLFGPDPVA